MRMWIELQQNKVSYFVGEWIHGRVVCNFHEPFDTSLLILSFAGIESIWTTQFSINDYKNILFQQQWVLFQM